MTSSIATDRADTRTPSQQDRSSHGTRFAIVAYGGLACWILLSVAGMLFMNDGHFIYTIDDPYIHLAISEGIHAGAYGINANETAAAASSILYPYLLAWAAPFSFHQYLPFAINLIAFGAILLLIRQFLSEAGLDRTPQGKIFSTIVVMSIPLTLNIIGLLFMGMEHSIQIALEVAVLLGLVRFLARERIAWWFVSAIILAPAIRYESIAVSGAALLLIAVNGRWRQAIVIGLALAGLMGAFSLYLISLGLSPLPGSVLAKSSVADDASTGTLSIFGSVATNLLINIFNAKGRILVLIMLVILWLGFGTNRLTRSSADRAIALFGIMAGGLFLVGGSFNILGRYEAAVYVTTTLVLIYLGREWLAARLQERAFARLSIHALAFSIVVGSLFYRGNFLIPAASNNIYDQQYQMHRLITEYVRGPVAANDIGWISYRNDGYILDLWGLASQKARKIRKAGYSAEDLERLILENNVELVMIYEAWFPSIRSTSLIPIARLTRNRSKVYAAQNSVTFYAPDSDRARILRQKLADFAQTLPKSARIEFL